MKLEHILAIVSALGLGGLIYYRKKFKFLDTLFQQIGLFKSDAKLESEIILNNERIKEEELKKEHLKKELETKYTEMTEDEVLDYWKNRDKK